MRRVVGAVTAILVFVLLLGATYQGVATALERREFGRPGGLVSVGDHQLHIYCTGKGTPAVVLEAPAAGLSAAWAEVQRQLSSVTRVCSYDRAGLGWSESGDRPFDPALVPAELRTLLSRANEQGPFVVVGQGLGAAFARMYAARPDADAAALVLIDPPRAADSAAGWIVPASPWLARTGVLRAGRILSSKADGLPGGGALRAFLNRPDHLSRAADELLAWNDLVRQTDGLQPASTRTRVISVDLQTSDRIAFLTNPAAVHRVVATIRAAMASPPRSVEADAQVGLSTKS
jgi:pimeloyl-ACP methyl ester carboxylesterase